MWCAILIFYLNQAFYSPYDGFRGSVAPPCPASADAVENLVEEFPFGRDSRLGTKRTAGSGKPATSPFTQPAGTASPSQSSNGVYNSGMEMLLLPANGEGNCSILPRLWAALAEGSHSTIRDLRSGLRTTVATTQLTSTKTATKVTTFPARQGQRWRQRQAQVAATDGTELCGCPLASATATPWSPGTSRNWRRRPRSSGATDSPSVDDVATNSPSCSCRGTCKSGCGCRTYGDQDDPQPHQRNGSCEEAATLSPCRTTTAGGGMGRVSIENDRSTRERRAKVPRDNEQVRGARGRGSPKACPGKESHPGASHGVFRERREGGGRGLGRLRHRAHGYLSLYRHRSGRGGQGTAGTKEASSDLGRADGQATIHRRRHPATTQPWRAVWCACFALYGGTSGPLLAPSPPAKATAPAP